MEFTFGIITAGNNDSMIKTIIDSIREQSIPNYEILIVGECHLTGVDIRVLPFDETIKPSWITKKKNILVQEANYENVVLLHDYVSFEKGWYEGFLKFGNNFSFCCTQIKDMDGSRFIDYGFHPFYVFCLDERFANGCLLPYDFTPSIYANKLMYISGTYYIIKKDLANSLPLDEEKKWGEGEDMDLSFAITHMNIPIQCNHFSSVKFLKQKNNDKAAWINEIKETSLLEKIQNFTEDDIYKWLNTPYGNLLKNFTLFNRLTTSQG